MTLRILFVERDLTTADLLIPSLERKGYHVWLVRTQRQAIAAIRTKCPNLLVLDVASFGVRGYDLCDLLQETSQQTPMVLLVPAGHDPLGCQAVAWMAPPFTSRRLLYRVKKAAQQVVLRLIEAGPLVLDPDARVVQKGDQTHRLRPKEAHLLALLMENAGRALSRRRIMKEVWETDYMGDTRTLNVHIHWLRTKVEEDATSPRLIHTIRGVGYLFKPVEEAAVR